MLCLVILKYHHRGDEGKLQIVSAGDRLYLWRYRGGALAVPRYIENCY